MEREPRHRLPSQAEKALDDLITSETLFALDASTALTEVFAGCTALSGALVLLPGVAVDRAALDGCPGLELAQPLSSPGVLGPRDFPSGMTKVRAGQFKGRVDLVAVFLPEGLIELEGAPPGGRFPDLQVRGFGPTAPSTSASAWRERGCRLDAHGRAGVRACGRAVVRCASAGAAFCGAADRCIS